MRERRERSKSWRFLTLNESTSVRIIIDDAKNVMLCVLYIELFRFFFLSFCSPPTLNISFGNNNVKSGKKKVWNEKSSSLAANCSLHSQALFNGCTITAAVAAAAAAYNRRKMNDSK